MLVRNALSHVSANSESVLGVACGCLRHHAARDRPETERQAQRPTDVDKVHLEMAVSQLAISNSLVSEWSWTMRCRVPRGAQRLGLTTDTAMYLHGYLRVTVLCPVLVDPARWSAGWRLGRVGCAAAWCRWLVEGGCWIVVAGLSADDEVACYCVDGEELRNCWTSEGQKRRQ